MDKNRISVQIAGKNYVLITNDNEKYVQSIASEVDRHIIKNVKMLRQLDVKDCAVLAALDFCDEKNKSARKNRTYVDKADKIIIQTNDLNKQCSEYKEKLAEAINENTNLTKRIRQLEKQLETLKNATCQKSDDSEKVEIQKTEEEKKNEKLMGYVPMEQVSLFDTQEDTKSTKNEKTEKSFKAQTNKNNKKG